MTHTLTSSLDAIDFFCGMGGSSTGLAEAGYTVKLAANHWQRAIETHSANHPNTEHLCADIQAIDLRRLPHARVLWASPICTEVSPAGGRKKARSDRYERHGHIDAAAFERTRVTFWEVLRAAELFRYDAVLVENVVEAADWELFEIWLAGMQHLGYNVQFVSVSAAHIWSIDSAPAPQWRDRIYLVFTRVGIPLPDLEPRPLAWCPACGHDVQALQWWKPTKRNARHGRRIGKYGPQYLYICPIAEHGTVEPYVAPAAAAIDFTDLGTRIGDRPRALVAASGNTYDGASGASNNYLRAWPAATSPTPAQTGTAQTGIAATGEFVMSVTHGHADTGRHFAPLTRPLPTATGKLGEALVVPAGGTWNTDARSALAEPHRAMLTRDSYALAVTEPFVSVLRNHATASRISEPLATFSAGGFHHGLTTPPGSFVAKSYGGHADPDASRMVRDAAADPIPMVRATGHDHLVVPAGAFIQKHHGGLDYEPIGHMLKRIDQPLPTTVARPNLSLVIPYRKGSTAHRSSHSPVSTIATREQHGLLHGFEPVAIEDCYFRMLTAREAANAQRFPHQYRILGNNGEQQMQAGNAVPVNVARWLGERVAAVLDTPTAA